MLTMELLCICGLLATLQNVTVAMHNPYQGATAPGLSNERKSGEHDDGGTQNSGGSVGGVGGGPVGEMMSSNNSSHGMPHGVPTDTQLAQSSHLQASQYGFVGVQQPPQQGLNSSPMSNSQFSGLSQQHYVTQQSMPQPGGVQMPTNIDLIMRLMNEYPDNPFNIQMFAFAQQQPCNPFVGQFIQMAYDQFKFQMQQTPSSKNIGTVSSKTGIPSPKNVNEPPTIIFQSYYLMNERVTYPISSKQYDEFLLMPYVLEARVHMDLERKRLPFYYLRKDECDKLLVDNVKVNINYEILVRQINYITLDNNDQWTKHLHFLRTEWIGKRKTNADSPYWKQLITASALNRSALLYMSLHNATFGQSNTDFDALNEIMH
uniref:NOT2_3_5 domain-containing protein n=1 Tax=Globodera pallida TaxID=36090 RepID=A0A183C057_GLOPA